MAQNYTAIKGTPRAIGEEVLVTEMHFGEQKTSGGIILRSDDGDTRGIYPRWAKVFSKGPRNKEPYEVGTMLPEKTRVVCDAHKCNRVVVNPDGFGEGREYVTNPPNKILDPLSKPDININNVCANSLDSLHYYPIQKDLYNKDELRNAIPGGGDVLSGGDANVMNE